MHKTAEDWLIKAMVDQDSGETEDLQIIFISVFFSIVFDDLNESTNTFPRVRINYQQNQLPCSKTGAASTSRAVCCWRSTITDRRWASSLQSGPGFDRRSKSGLSKTFHCHHLENKITLWMHIFIETAAIHAVRISAYLLLFIMLIAEHWECTKLNLSISHTYHIYWDSW